MSVSFGRTRSVTLERGSRAPSSRARPTPPTARPAPSLRGLARHGCSQSPNRVKTRAGVLGGTIRRVRDLPADLRGPVPLVLSVVQWAHPAPPRWKEDLRRLRL